MAYTHLYSTQVEFFKNWKNKHPESKITYAKYRRIIADMSNLIQEEVLNNTEGFLLPYDFGYLIILGVKITSKKRYIYRNYKTVRTEGYAYKMVWNTGKLPKRKLYKINTPKLFKDKIVEYIKADKFFYWKKTLPDKIFKTK